MLNLRRIVKHVPGARSANVAYLAARNKYQWVSLGRRSIEDVFTHIFHGNEWNGSESKSGPGSDFRETKSVRAQLPYIYREYDIHTMLDIPCGDFNWMKHVNFESIFYTGADIVEDVIRQNSQYEASNISFCVRNLIKDKLPKVDIVLCRDCLVHFSLKDAFSALRNLSNSGSTYLLVTTFPSRQGNCDIATGQWRPLNLERAPFSFPPPLKSIREECMEAGGIYSDKSLGLWKIADIASYVANGQSGPG
jgi:hypothetical protein